MSLKLFILIAASLLLQSGAFLSLKYTTILGGIFTWALYGFALALMFSRAFVWQKILGLSPLSKVYPFTLLTQVLLFLYGVVLFDEHYNIYHIVGLGVIFCGLWMIFHEDDKQC